MSPTIRIDDEVYKWLQSQAIPFQDNPNSVLRRLAGLDRPVTREDAERGTKERAVLGTPEDQKKPRARLISSSPGSSRGSTLMAGTSPAMTSKEGRRSGETRQSRTSGRRRPLARGADLLRRWRISARQARFHRDGSWYERLNRFPAAYCDCNGYIVFDSEDDVRTTPGIRVEPSGQVAVPSGISSVPGYRKVNDPIKDPDHAGDLET
jgi:hypothetical protein